MTDSELAELARDRFKEGFRDGAIKAIWSRLNDMDERLKRIERLLRHKEADL